MRLLHTSDWHLGHTLRDHAREAEHATFLRWLIETSAAEAIDLLIVAGDVFDTSLPTAAAEALWFEFLAAFRERMPAARVVVIAGNHDSPSRLAAASALCERLGIHVVTTVAPDVGGVARALIDLGDAMVVAMPYLRPLDLPVGVAPADAAQQLYGEALTLAQARRRVDQPIIVVGHLFATGASTEWLSERRSSLGGSEAVEGASWASRAEYVALGHIHKSQRVGVDHVRYAGSPIAMAVDERHYGQRVLVADVEAGRPAVVREVRVPQAIAMARVPARGHAPLDEVLGELARLPRRGPEGVAENRAGLGAEVTDTRAYLDVAVRLTDPEPRLRARIDEAIADKDVRLVRLVTEYAGDAQTLAGALPGQALAELAPEEVLARRWARDYKGDVPTEILAEFGFSLARARGEETAQLRAAVLRREGGDGAVTGEVAGVVAAEASGAKRGRRSTR